MKLLCVVLLSLVTFGCGSYKAMNPAAGTIPHILQLVPNSATAGGAGFVLTVNGTNFGNNAVVYWDSVAHNAGYVTNNQVTVQISPSEVADPGTVLIYVRTNGQNSNTVMFMVQ
jgi:hypothetical protein